MMCTFFSISRNIGEEPFSPSPCKRRKAPVPMPRKKGGFSEKGEDFQFPPSRKKERRRFVGKVALRGVQSVGLQVYLHQGTIFSLKIIL